MKNNSGVVLIATLWITIILSILAVGISRQSRIELNLTKHHVNQIKNNGYAWAGIVYSMEQIYLDSKDEKSNDSDTLRYCALRQGSTVGLEQLYQQKNIGDGLFDVRYLYKDGSQEERVAYGLSDEERKINVNGINVNNSNVLISLLKVLGLSEQEANQITFAIIDWIDLDTVLSNNEFGAENEYYTTLNPSYKTKNTNFDSLEELMLVKGVNKDIYLKIKDYLTVFPKSGGLLVNFDTASRTTLQALANSFVGEQTNTQLPDATSLVNKIINYRMGDDAVSISEDDRVIDFNDMDLNASEQTLFLAMSGFRTEKSDMLRTQVVAGQQSKTREVVIDAVINREDLSVVYWKRK